MDPSLAESRVSFRFVFQLVTFYIWLESTKCPLWNIKFSKSARNSAKKGVISLCLCGSFRRSDLWALTASSPENGRSSLKAFMENKKQAAAMCGFVCL